MPFLLQKRSHMKLRALLKSIVGLFTGVQLNLTTFNARICVYKTCHIRPLVRRQEKGNQQILFSESSIDGKESGGNKNISLYNLTGSYCWTNI